jgi:hypothetical protein
MTGFLEEWPLAVGDIGIPANGDGLCVFVAFSNELLLLDIFS